jgi:hypothetical protein
VRGRGQAGAAVLGLACGVALLWSAVEWMGFGAARLLDPGRLLARPDLAPACALVGGAVALGVGGFLVRPAWEGVVPRGVAPWLLAAATALLLLPLLPAAVTTASGSAFHYDEISLASKGAGEPDLLAPAAWGWLRIAVVADLGLACVAALWWSSARLSKGWLARLPAVGAAVAALAATWAVFYLRVGEMAGGTVAWANPLPPLAIALLWVVAVRGLRRRPDPSPSIS